MTRLQNRVIMTTNRNSFPNDKRTQRNINEFKKINDENNKNKPDEEKINLLDVIVELNAELE